MIFHKENIKITFKLSTLKLIKVVTKALHYYVFHNIHSIVYFSFLQISAILGSDCSIVYCEVIME